jgi:hypothetical protein
MRRVVLLLLCAAALAPPPAHAQNQRPLTVSYDVGAGYRPVIAVGPILADDELREAALSGLPLRVRIRVELWKDRFFDALVDTAGVVNVLLYEPIGEQFVLRTQEGAARRFPSFAAARQAIETQYSPRIQPREPGRFYYTVSLQVESLSVSDLEELERWLQGELQPAVRGERSVPGALGQGAKRLMLRLLDLPARRHDARTGRFRVPDRE